MEILEANQKRYKDIIELSERLTLKDKVEDIIMSIDEDESLTNFEKIYVAYFTGYVKCHNWLWPEFKNKTEENMELIDQLHKLK